jgi:hypothetical protein
MKDLKVNQIFAIFDQFWSDGHARAVGKMVTPCVIDAVVNAAKYTGEMAEWSNAAVSKTVVRQSVDRGFEPPSLRTSKLLPQPAAGFLFLELSKRSLRKGQK